MKRTTRLFRFSLVGAIGIAVQLGVLAALVKLRINYLLATALAVESAVLHNFLWHQRFTWADRPGQAMLARLLRFHLSNGLISLLGNLLMMRWLVGWCGIPVILANTLTISICFVANFLASDRWVFIGREWWVEDGTRSFRAVSHQNQCALSEGNINERSRDAERQPQSDLRSEQERRQGPQFVDHKCGGKQLAELAAEIPNIERHCRKQVKPNRDSDCGGYDKNNCHPGWSPKRLLQQILNHRNPRQGRNVKAQVHDLDQEKQNAHIPVRHVGEFLGMSEERSGPWRNIRLGPTCLGLW